ncbi:MAG TPA: DUF6265 family protein [Longimicrobiales bacterium]|nr:DUF6265 family protein [Longimicrobiales bacterium]
MHRPCILTLPLLLALAARPAPPIGIEQLHWLTGCWESTGADGRIDEQWMAPAGGMMLGMSRTIRGDRTVAYESLRIYEHDSSLVYAAQPSGQSAAEFRSSVVTEAAATFENPEHDYPQRIAYRLAGDSLIARIEGIRGDAMRGSDFRYVRARCAQGEAP